MSTSLAVLPVFEDGGRGCWVDLSANDLLTPDAVSSHPNPVPNPNPDPNPNPNLTLTLT